MNTVQQRIIEQSRRLPKGALLAPRSFLHLGSRAAVDQAFSRMARSGELVRVGRGRYVRPRQTRFGPRIPSPSELVEELAQATGEVVVPGGAAAAHGLGLTTQVPIRAVYLTSGATRELKLGSQTVELRNAPAWKLWGAGTREGEVLRALEWIGQGVVTHQVAKRAVERLEPEERARLMLACASAPSWLSRVITGALFPSEREGANLGNA
jgi:hypothetical protein